MRLANDIFIGAADNIPACEILPWCASIRECGFTGDVYLICYRIDQSVREVCRKYNVQLYEVQHDQFMQPLQHQISNSPTVVHNTRFYHAWELLTRIDNHYRYAIMTDVRDVYFQKNPIEWLETHFFNCLNQSEKIVISSEGLQYKNESWGLDNMQQGYGPIVTELDQQENRIYNVGVLAGNAELMKDLCLVIYSMSQGRYYPSDQNSANLLFHGILKDKVISTTHNDSFAAQLGTTNDESKSHLWEHLEEPRPVITQDGEVLNSKGEPFYIVHQYNRNQHLNLIIKNRYKE